MRWPSGRLLAPVVLTTVLVSCASPPPARALDAGKPICGLAGLVSGVIGKACTVARHAGSVIKAGKKLLGGHLGGAVETLTGSGSAARVFTAATAFAAAGAWVIGGARLVLHETGAVISATTRPQLQSTWFSASYWRMAGISALLTLPFLFAAAIQAILRSDLSLLVRSAFGYLPLGLLGVSIAAPLTQLMLAASDELSALVSSASGYSTAAFAHVGFLALSSGSVSAFPLFFVGLLAVAATMTLWIELLIRSAAVYVIVLMLPLFFAALVWPARRVWLVRALELLVALILSKFAIVAVLALGGTALGHTVLPNVTQMLAGTTLVMLAALSPWALLRLLPLHELASGVEGLRGAPARSLPGVGAAGDTVRDRLTALGRQSPEQASDPAPADAPSSPAQRLGEDDLAAPDASDRGTVTEPEGGAGNAKGAGTTGSPEAATVETAGASAAPVGADYGPGPESGLRPAAEGDPNPSGDPSPTEHPRPSPPDAWAPGMQAPFVGADWEETVLGPSAASGSGATATQPSSDGPGEATPAQPDPGRELRPEPQEPEDGTL